MSRNNRTDRTDLKGWIDIGSDLGWDDYGGKWARLLRPGVYLVLRFENMEEACGSRAVEDGEIERYSCDVLCVDLRAVAESGALTSALQSCGWSIKRRATFADCETDADGPTMPGIVNDYDGEVIADAHVNLERFDLVCVEACVGYGAFAHLAEFTANVQARHVRGKARRFAEELIREEPYNVKSPILPSRVDALMERTVNKIGSTAREMMVGDVYSALRRGKGDPEVDLIRQMYASAERTLGGELIPEDIRDGS